LFLKEAKKAANSDRPLNVVRVTHFWQNITHNQAKTAKAANHSKKVSSGSKYQKKSLSLSKPMSQSSLLYGHWGILAVEAKIRIASRWQVQNKWNRQYPKISQVFLFNLLQLPFDLLSPIASWDLLLRNKTISHYTVNLQIPL
jgi:hypothetical protein